jgi:hypothetical protein
MKIAHEKVGQPVGAVTTGGNREAAMDRTLTTSVRATATLALA